MKGKILFLVIIQFFYLKAQQIILPVNDNFELKVKVKVSIHPSDSSKFIYEYSIKNMPTSGQPICSFDVSNELSWSLVVDTVIPPVNWECIPEKPCWQSKRISKSPDIWADLYPGDSLSGFIFHDRKLPDIGYWYSEGMDTIVFPQVINMDVEELEDSLQKIYYNKTPFGPGKYGHTVGPGPYPPMKPIWPWGHYPDSAFIHLRDRLEKCKEQGWVTQHAYDQIWRLIGHALNHLQQGRLEQSKRTLTRLMETLERLKGQEKITEEAFYILYYRTKYVRDNLWCRGDKK
ncbi:MAG: hypothetical protein ABIM49_07080 [candidate division WOR-3 bacterium]